MQSLRFNNKWVLVTGASSGLGYEMAVQLANYHKANLILMARRKERLEDLKNKLERETGVQVKVIAADLSKADEAENTIKQLLAEVDLYGAILNAGITFFGRNADLSQQQFEAILQTNVVSTVRITNLLVSHFEQKNKEGGLMLVSSMAALYPVPYQALYSGTKAFILNYASALSYELKNKAFSITVFAPGGIATEMTEGEKFGGLKKWLMPVNTAAKEAINAFINRKHIYIPGLANKFGNFFMKLLPKKFIVNQLGNTYQKALLEAEKVD